ALCGADRVGTPEVLATHRVDVFRVNVPEFDAERRSPNQRVGDPQPYRADSKIGAPGLPPRRFRPAVSAHIEFREHRPALLRSPVFNGAIVQTRGPFLSSGHWWEPGRWAREEWDVQ